MKEPISVKLGNDDEPSTIIVVGPGKPTPPDLPAGTIVFVEQADGAGLSADGRKLDKKLVAKLRGTAVHLPPIIQPKPKPKDPQ